jgi:excisionase family DNA binding protein
MLNVEIRFVRHGKEVSVDSFVETIMREVRAAVRQEFDEALSGQANNSPQSSHRVNSEMPRHAVSIREAARLLSISPRTVHKYVALNVIRTVRVGRRVLIPMRSVNEVATRGIPPERRRASAREQQG